SENHASTRRLSTSGAGRWPGAPRGAGGSAAAAACDMSLPPPAALRLLVRDLEVLRRRPAGAHRDALGVDHVLRVRVRRDLAALLDGRLDHPLVPADELVLAGRDALQDVLAGALPRGAL